MISNNTKLFCLLAFALAASGCSGGGGDEVSDPLIVDDSVLVTDSIIPPDDTTVTDVTAVTEITDSTETSDGIATPVQPVSSVQMDGYIANPLLAAIPAELSGGTSSAPNSFISNPLMQ